MHASNVSITLLQAHLSSHFPSQFPSPPKKSESVPSLMSLPVELGGVCEAKYVLMTRPDLIVFQLPLEPSTHRPGN